MGNTGSKDVFVLGERDEELIKATRVALGILASRPNLAQGAAERVKALDEALARLPEPTPDLEITLTLSSRQESDGETLECGWSIEVSDDAITFDVGGCVEGPCGSDGFSRFNYSLFAGREGEGDSDLSMWTDGFPDVARAGWELQIE